MEKYADKTVCHWGHPSNFLIGPNGTVIIKNLRGKDLEKKLKIAGNYKCKATGVTKAFIVYSISFIQADLLYFCWREDIYPVSLPVVNLAMVSCKIL